MAKIVTKADLVLGTNYKLRLVDYQGTDIAIDATGSQITSTTTDFTAETEATAGLVKRAAVVGDILTVTNTGAGANEEIELVVTSVAANAIGYTVSSGTPVDETAGADINIQAFKKTFEFIEAGALLFIDGVEAIYFASEVVDIWNTLDFDRYNKIFTSIEPRAKSLACLNGWEPENDNTLFALRDMALEIRDTAASAARRIYFNASSGDLHAATDQFYFWPATDAEMDAPTAAVTQGYINQLILLVDTDNAIDNRGDWTFRCLEPGKTHLQETIDIQYAEIKPVGSGNAIDPKLADPGTFTQLVDDATVLAGGIYANIAPYVDADLAYDGDVNSVLYTFKGYVEEDLKTNEDVHTKIHYLLRQPVNINVDGTGPDIRGDKTPKITEFSGDLLSLYDYYPLNYNTAQRNFINPVDSTGSAQAWPSIYTLSIPADAVSIGGTFSVFHKDTHGLSDAVYLQDESGTPQKDIPIISQTNIVIAFSTYNVDSHTPNTPLPLVLAWNKPGAIEPDNKSFTMEAANQSQAIAPTIDPSYVAA